MSDTDWPEADDDTGVSNAALGPSSYYDPATDSGFASLNGDPYGQTLYHLAMGGDPQDLGPNLQHIVGHAQMLQPPPEPQAPGLLGEVSRHLAATAAPAAQDFGVQADEGDDAEKGDSDGEDDNAPDSDDGDDDQGPVVAADAPIVQGPLDVQTPEPKYTALVTATHLRSIFPKADPATIDSYVEPINAAFRQHGINTPEQQAAFFGQAAVENPKMNQRELYNSLAETNRNYAGKNGNGDAKSGDGFRYRGGGLIQITGRTGYRDAGLENNPEAISEPGNSANASSSYWITKPLADGSGTPLNEASTSDMDRKQYDRITRAVNGGTNKADERWSAYRNALNVLRPRS